MAYLAALLLGIDAGLRALTPLAAVSWAARLGRWQLGGTPLAFFGFAWTPYILTALALGEIVNDKLPKTPSRLVPMQFGTRLLTGALSGAGAGAAGGSLWLGALAGAVGAVAGTYGGAALRGGLARTFGRDLPAALTEDVLTVGLAILAVLAL